MASGSYDCDTGTFLLKFPKVNKGEHFENLDMITILLAPPIEKTRVNIGPSIEVIGTYLYIFSPIVYLGFFFFTITLSLALFFQTKIE